MSERLDFGEVAGLRISRGYDNLRDDNLRPKWAIAAQGGRGGDRVREPVVV